jgi:universal stress protein F
MYERIIVPADLTDRNRNAVEAAGQLVEKKSGTVYLLHVIETIPGFAIEEERDFYAKLEKRATEHLEELGEVLGGKGIQWAAEVAYGPRAKTILEEASKLDADLIVIQSHRLDRDHPQEGWGTLSYQVGILSDRPVLLVK